MAWFRRTADERRQRALRGAVVGPLAAYLATPFQADHRPLAEVEFLALDYETTGMDPDRDHVVAVGFVPVVGGRIETEFLLAAFPEARRAEVDQMLTRLSRSGWLVPTGARYRFARPALQHLFERLVCPAHLPHRRHG